MSLRVTVTPPSPCAPAACPCPARLGRDSTRTPSELPLPSPDQLWSRKPHAPHAERHRSGLYTLRTVVATSRSAHLCRSLRSAVPPPRAEKSRLPHRSP